MKSKYAESKEMFFITSPPASRYRWEPVKVPQRVPTG